MGTSALKTVDASPDFTRFEVLSEVPGTHGVAIPVRQGEPHGTRSISKMRSWTIPGSRMKARMEHRVPLSDQAVAVLMLAQRT